ncbi:MAG: glycosyltransferase family 2 protein [Acidimicrobiales bacterium]
MTNTLAVAALGEARWLWTIIQWVALSYVIALQAVQVALVVVVGVHATRRRRRPLSSIEEDVFLHGLAPGISVLVPAHNEAAGVEEAVRSLLALRYPNFEVVVVDDGSVDDTFGRLATAFDLIEVPCLAPGPLTVQGAVHSCHRSRHGEALAVLRKASVGHKADALNAALNQARHPLVCMVDADSLLEPMALSHLAGPFLEDPARVVVTGGVIRPVNDCVVRDGHLHQVRLARRWLVRVQVVEYLRSFLVGRVAWSAMGGLLIVSGALGLFRRDAIIEAGGVRVGSVGEDAELVVRLHRHLRNQRQDYRVVFVPEALCWTETPAQWAPLGRQRRRWSRGLAETLVAHRSMLANPRFGRIGLLAMPYLVLFELCTPVVEVLGLIILGVSAATGLVHVTVAVLLAALAVAAGTLVSVASLLVEQLALHRHRQRGDLALLLVAALLENLGYRQLHAWWRLQGLIDAARGSRRGWGHLPRQGFGTATPTGPSPSSPVFQPADHRPGGG